MKALYIPSTVLVLAMALSLLTGAYTDRCTDQWLTGLEAALTCSEEDQWNDALTQLFTVHRDWKHHQGTFHLFLEHQDLDEAEKLFAGTIAACQERDIVELRIHLKQLATQLAFLAETQAVSIQNIL